MKDIIRAAAALCLAFISLTLLENFTPAAVHVINILSLVVFYFAMRKEEVFCAVLGMICGLIQDSFSIGVFGVSGIAKTLSGFAAGFFARRFNVISFRRNFLFIFFLSTFELVIWALLYTFLFSENIPSGRGLIFFQPLGTAVCGSLLIHFIGTIRKTRGIGRD
ncbi:MAG: rod shape-determining protein MreD [Candidatus Aminicenantes bacterium]|nr:rod shape-determining protein MreD [Candidatus Aminicenantes bacterium]